MLKKSETRKSNMYTKLVQINLKTDQSRKRNQYSTDHVTNQNSTRDSVSRRGKSTKRPGVTPIKQKSCIFCGYNHEMQKEKCPAWGKVCSACKGRNHFKARCKKVHSLERENSDSDDDYWLASVKGRISDKVMANMIINDCEIKFQIDTGAQVNTICQKYVKKEQAQKSNTTLKMWNKTSLKSLGETTLTLKNPLNEEEHEVNFVIVPNNYECLLGLKTIQKLNLITVNSEKFIGKVVRDLGDLGAATLKLTPSATPKALPARNIPLAIRDQVKEEINNLVDRGILVPVIEPTEWVNQMAVPRKRNGQIRICLDPQL